MERPPSSTKCPGSMTKNSAICGLCTPHDGPPWQKAQLYGQQFAQFIEWRYAEQLDWLLLDYDRHRQMQSFVRDLNHFYLSHAQFWQNEQDWDASSGFSPTQGMTISWPSAASTGGTGESWLSATSAPWSGCVPPGRARRGIYKPVLCSDSLQYGGSGTQIHPAVSERVSFRDYKLSACFDIPPCPPPSMSGRIRPKARLRQKK